jgi:hypothetical protein
MQRHTNLCILAVLSTFLLVACDDAGASATGSPSPAIAARVTTPFPAYAAATPAARLHDRPGGTPGRTLERGTDLQVEAVTALADNQLWYRVTTADGAGGWLPAAALSLVDHQPPTAPTGPAPIAAGQPTPATTVTAATTTASPRPLVVSGSGQGLFLRAQPGQGDVIGAYADGTRIVPLGEETRLEGRRWLRVRAPDGREGWMAAEYLRPSP